MTAKTKVMEALPLFQGGTGGIDSWLGAETPDAVFERIARLDRSAIRSHVEFNQLLTLGHTAPVSQGFFSFYWQRLPAKHIYNIESTPGHASFRPGAGVTSIDHLAWGLYRFYVDALLVYGSIRTGYQELRALTDQEIERVFSDYMYDSSGIASRGESLELVSIPQDDRYLISEMACKSFDPELPEGVEKVLEGAYAASVASGRQRVSIKELLEGDSLKTQHVANRQNYLFAVQDILDVEVRSLEELQSQTEQIVTKWKYARGRALANTETYLAMVGDLDAYVATSMRKREDFRNMAKFCDDVFDHASLQDLKLKFFDPTQSAARNHEDKGIIECLMVKLAKILVFYAGAADSFGKDAEAAMALSLGKPVIIYCTDEPRYRVYKDLHPLSRLIKFESGVVVGAMVTKDVGVVRDLIRRILGNGMEYELRTRKGNASYLHLVEKLTGSAVRLQTSDKLLRETFWNHYHRQAR